MLIEVRLEREGLVTAFTLEILIDRMRLHVCTQIGAVRKGFATMCAAVGLFARMRAQMALQQPGTREELAADITTVRELVREQVHGERGHGDVRLAASVTLLGRLRVE